MKDVSIKKKQKESFPFWHKECDPHPECPFLPSTTPTHCPSTHPPSLLPTFSTVVSFVICGSCVSLFYCFIWPLLCCGQRDNNSQSLLFTRAAVGCHILCPHLLVFLGFFFLVSCCFRFLSAVLIQLCLRCHNIQFPLDSWGFMVNTAQKAQYIANTVFYLP